LMSHAAISGAVLSITADSAKVAIT
jgi:hypothetical protein